MMVRKQTLEETYRKLAKLKMRVIDVEQTERGRFYKPRQCWDNFMQGHWQKTEYPGSGGAQAQQQWFDQNGIILPDQPGAIVEHIYFKTEQHMVEWILRWGA